MKLLVWFTILLSVVALPSAFAGGFSILPGSARAVSFGGSLVSTADGPNVIFYNPAGVGSLTGLSFSTSFVQLFTGIQGDNLRYLTASASANLGLVGQLGFGARVFRADAWNENELIGAYSQNLFDVVMIGGSVRLLQWSTPAPSGLRAVPEDGLSKATMTFDAGLQARWADVFPDNDIIIGVAVSNINAPSIAVHGSEDARLDQRISAGITYASSVYDYLLTAHFTSQGPSKRFAGGAEFVAMKADVFSDQLQFIVRAGGGVGIGGTEQGDIGGGVGFVWNGFRIDYAYQYQTVLQYLSGSHFITLHYAL